MRIVPPSHEILFMPDGDLILRNIEVAGRTCYKSEDKITPDSAAGFVKRIIASGHHSVIEHMNITARFVCDRGVSHELVRHRLAAYSQESTRYANYGKDKFGNRIALILPLWYPNLRPGDYSQAPDGNGGTRLVLPESVDAAALLPAETTWLRAMLGAEAAYLALLAAGEQAQQARGVLPNALKTEIVMTANLREWRHVFSVRCSPAAHPQIRQLLLPFLADLRERIPAVFDDVYDRFRDSADDASRSDR
jgi:thymidylate synthase (FAD)